MKQWIQKKGWKLLGVVLVLYSILMGMMVPLHSGISARHPLSAQAGDTTVLEIEGYNTHFAQAQDHLRVWLMLGDQWTLSAEHVAVVDERHIKATFILPDLLPVDQQVGSFTLVVDNPIDGVTLLPEALFVRQTQIDTQTAIAHWPQTDPMIELHSGPALTFPFRNILRETIRNTYFHVPMWFAMIFIFIGSVIYSLRYLRHQRADDDRYAAALTTTGIVLGILGLFTGMVWANYTWGRPWSGDIKQNMTAIALLVYMAYFVLRFSLEDNEVRARVSAAYNIFAFAALIPLIFVIPRLTDSLHPGNGGNPALGSEDLDNTMRLVFYPAVIGWTLIGYWMSQLLWRTNKLKAYLEAYEDGPPQLK